MVGVIGANGSVSSAPMAWRAKAGPVPVILGAATGNYQPEPFSVTDGPAGGRARSCLGRQDVLH